MADARTLKVVAASANAEHLFGAHARALHGRPLEGLLEGDRLTLARRIRAGELEGDGVVRLGAAGRMFDAGFHRVGPHLVVELEPVPLLACARAAARAAPERLHDALGRLRSADTEDELVDIAVAELRELTGFDAVCVRRCSAAAAAEGPVDAVRVIPDVDYEPSPLVPAVDAETGAPFDLSCATLRCPSPAQLALLRSLGVRASLSMPLGEAPRPWGVLSCHHATPHFASVETRRAFKLFGRLLAWHRALLVEKAELRDAVRSRDELLSMASHELRTPLSTLELQVEVLLRLAAGQPELPLGAERVERSLTMARRQLSRFEQLVSELLDLSRGTAGRLEIQPVEGVDLAALVREVLSRFADELPASRVALVESGPLVGCWDASRVDQIVTNLVSNAIKYCGGKPIRVELAGDEAGVTIAVRDEGVGLSPEDQSRLFARFHRARASERRVAGAGLGLWIVKLLTEAHGGDVGVESVEGVGSTFRVRLPRRSEARALGVS